MRLRSACAGPSTMTDCRTTSRGVGCSRPATPYGALLLEQGQWKRRWRPTGPTWASTTRCRAQRHPNNVGACWYHECLTRLGEHEQARILRQQLDFAMAQADVPIQASCACRLFHARSLGALITDRPGTGRRSPSMAALSLSWQSAAPTERCPSGIEGIDDLVELGLDEGAEVAAAHLVSQPVVQLAQRRKLPPF